MDPIKALIIGIIQGITEWLPISSEGIVALIMVTFFGSTLVEAVFLALWTHIGTLFAAIIFFRNDMGRILRSISLYLKESKKSRSFDTLTGFLIVSTFLTGLVGAPILLYSIDKMNFPGNLATAVIGVLLILTGIVQLSADKKKKIFRQMQIADAVPVGVAQGFAILPGISRSGITVSTLLFLGYSGKKALRTSFLMSIPVILGAEIGLALLNKIPVNLTSIILVVSAFVTGIVTIKFFLKLAEKIRFGYLCIIIGIISALAFFV